MTHSWPHSPQRQSMAALRPRHETRTRVIRKTFAQLGHLGRSPGRSVLGRISVMHRKLNLSKSLLCSSSVNKRKEQVNDQADRIASTAWSPPKGQQFSTRHVVAGNFQTRRGRFVGPMPVARHAAPNGEDGSRPSACDTHREHPVRVLAVRTVGSVVRDLIRDLIGQHERQVKRYGYCRVKRQKRA